MPPPLAAALLVGSDQTEGRSAKRPTWPPMAAGPCEKRDEDVVVVVVVRARPLLAWLRWLGFEDKVALIRGSCSGGG